MKVVILAAGKGTRMLPLTETFPKVLVPINGKPFLYYLMRNLQKAGYSEFSLVVGYKKDKIQSFLKEYGFEAELIEQKEQLGTGHAVLQAKNFVNNEEFIVLGGDNLWGVDDLKGINQKDEFNYISGLEVENPEKYGVLVEEKGLLKDIKEKPKQFVGYLINTGLYKFKSEVFTYLENVIPSVRGEIELTSAIAKMAEKNKVKVLRVLTYWKDLGCIKDVEPLEHFLKEVWSE
ncbi:hypothetical protein COY27_01670 [Candidatus Woesearchaeota archaeon CG_4_10_14_0_2_um_filter_33_13]|nr:MAG: hypothetical protein COY27_01670 [Candidatus Woesearchaeota archaeon CG_4_10_14_0_2_um_filter_33_13]